MTPGKRRETILKIAVGAAAALFLLDRLVLSPAVAGWKAQSARLAALQQKVTRGRQLLARANTLHVRWDEMLRANMPDDVSDAENEVYNALSRWTLDSRVGLTSLTQQWRSHEEGYETFECRATAAGDQAALARLVYEIETDPLPACVEECEVSARDAQGKVLGLSLRFSFVHIADARRGAR